VGVILLRVPGTLEYRSLALRCVSEACKIAQRDDWEGASLDAQTVSALGEAFNNVAIHAYADRPPGDVIVEISWTREEMVLQLTDYGQSFDPDAVDLPDLDELPEGGMGLFIMRSFMDEVEYHAGPPNVLRMTKRRLGRTEGEMAPMSKRGASLRPSAAKSSKPPEGDPPEAPAKQRSSPPPPKGLRASSQSGWRMKAVSATPAQDEGAAQVRYIGGSGRK
jgi:serine/threonine-protein kinase RsbW